MSLTSRLESDEKKKNKTLHSPAADTDVTLEQCLYARRTGVSLNP